MLDGAARIDDLFTACAQLGMDSLAITDHGNMFGAYEFWSKAREHGINPIIGMEGYVAPGSRHVRSRATLDGSLVDDTNPGEMYTHMTLLAETTAGMHNLFRLSSLASLEGMYYKPRMDRELLQEYAGGLIATTGCPSGEVARLLQKGQFDAACAAAGDYADIFGAGNYYVEYMDHGTDIERSTLPDLHRLQQRLGLPAVATNDLHYVKPEDATAHDALLCVQTKKTLDDPRRFRFEGTGYHLKSPAEMRGQWDDMVPDACDNTLAIAQRCHVEFAPRDLMPHAEVPAGETEDNWLRGQVARGLYRRFPDGVPAEHVKQAAYELDVICKMGYPGYFLVVADLVDYAREHGIQVGPGRGSVAGSLVAYALGITRLDPIAHRLVFERFLNPERPSMPDIDLDFDDRRRGEMLEYVARRYGDDRVAQIVTYSEIKAKSAVKDAAHVLHGQPGYAIADRITKALPKPIMGKDAPLAAVFDAEHKRYAEAAEVRRLYADDPTARQIIDTARGLEGLKRQWGVHAAGVIVSSQPLLDVLPIQRRVSDGAIITQFEMYTCEALGLLKMDFLGLRNLTVLADALANVEAATGTRIDLDTLPLTDKATYDLIARGDTLGVFQLDGGPIRDLLRRMAPTRFEDISAVLALYRPGPMGAGAHTAYADRKNGREPVTPIHPELGEPLADILGETYGLIVYQEQVMAIAQKVAGYTLGAADVLRRAMGKKKIDVLNREYERFTAGMHANGYSDEAIKTLWDLLIPFSDYAFNRCVSGDTVVTRAGRGSHDHPQTVRSLADRVHGRDDYVGHGCRFCREDRPVVTSLGECRPCKSWRAKWRMMGGMNAVGRIGDRVGQVLVTDVFRQGVKPLWRVTLANDASITTTANHRHLTPDGWRRVDQLSIGDQVSVMSDGEWGISSPRTDTPGSSDWVTLHGYTVGVRSHGKAGPMLHGRHAEFARNTATLARQCAKCGSPEGRLERAHLDGNPMNNAAENLAILCNSCHKRHDYANGGRVKRWAKGRRIDTSAIVSIEYVGEQMTYDVAVASDDHSWVANDSIITHNSHSAGYGLLSYWTAYLKCHHPAQYMAALLTSTSDDKDRCAVYLAECRKMGIPVLPPDVNDSAAQFTAHGHSVRVGLGAIRNLGETAVAAVVAGRPYYGFHDYLRKVGPKGINKTVVASLIKAGAFDAMGAQRGGLHEVHEAAIRSAAAQWKAERVGQWDLFGDQVTVPEVTIPTTRWAPKHQLAEERGMLGLYVSDHPLRGMEHALDDATAIATVLEGELPDGLTVTVAGALSAVARKANRQGEPWAVCTLEDLAASIEVVCFARVYARVGEQLGVDAVVRVRGRVSVRDDRISVIADEVTAVEGVPA
jgi:DNA-directed DNA polymerase III PolC